jgi:hypothetical protein
VNSNNLDEDNLKKGNVEFRLGWAYVRSRDNMS